MMQDDGVTKIADEMWEHTWARLHGCKGCGRLDGVRVMARDALTGQPEDVRRAAITRLRPVVGVGANVRARLLLLTGRPDAREMTQDSPSDSSRSRTPSNDYLLQLVARAYRDGGLPPCARLEDAVTRMADGEIDRERWLDLLHEILLPHLHIAPVLGCAGDTPSWEELRKDVASCRRHRLVDLVYTLDPWVIVCVGSGAFAALMGMSKPRAMRPAWVTLSVKFSTPMSGKPSKLADTALPEKATPLKPAIWAMRADKPS